MNSKQGYKGFLTFLLIAAIGTSALIGVQLVNKPTNTKSKANLTKIIPIDVYPESITNTSATITWKTNEESANTLYYSNSENTCLSKPSNCTQIVENSPTKNHKIILENLQQDTTYYYRIKTPSGMYPTDATYYIKTRKTAPDVAEIEKIEENENDTSKQNEFNKEDYFGIIPLSKLQKKIDSQEKETNNENNDTSTKKNTDSVLGIQTVNVEKVISEEFKTAMKYNDFNYDFNHDGTVNMLDYPLFINFVIGDN